MLDIKYIINNKVTIINNLIKLNELDLIPIIDKIIELSLDRKRILLEVESWNYYSKKSSKEWNSLSEERKEEIKQEKYKRSEALEKLSNDLKLIETELNDLLLTIPNMPHESVPIGKNEFYNRVVRYGAYNKNLLNNIDNFNSLYNYHYNNFNRLEQESNNILNSISTCKLDEVDDLLEKLKYNLYIAEIEFKCYIELKNLAYSYAPIKYISKYLKLN